MAFFFGRTTFIGSGAADELDEGCWYDGYEDVDGSPMELLGTRLFVEDENRWGWATVPSGISPSRSTTKASE